MLLWPVLQRFTSRQPGTAQAIWALRSIGRKKREEQSE